MATKYVILKQSTAPEKGEIESLDVVGEAEGASDESAINTFLATGDNGETFGEGNYRAVPARSWKVHEKKRKISW